MKISVYGMGKLGLPLALLLSDSGFEVYGVDVYGPTIEKINKKISPITEPGVAELLLKTDVIGTTDAEWAANVTDVSFIVVPTPSGSNGVFTSKYVVDAVRSIGAGIATKNTKHTVIITSTVMPGSCDSEIIPALEEASGKRLGEGFNVCYSPEFIALGTVLHDMAQPDMVLIGQSDEEAGDILQQITTEYLDYQPRPVHRMSIVNAEIAKISLNTYVTMKISYANTISDICEKIPGGNAYEVTKAIGSDRRIGSPGLMPGTSYGGPCFPRDTIAFSQMCHSLGLESELAEATDYVNRKQVRRVADIVIEEYGPNDVVAIMGMAYKPGTDVYERALGPALVRHLRTKGLVVIGHDPKARPDDLILASYADVLDLATIIVITTPWKEYGTWHFGKRRVIDCWNIVNPVNKNVRRVGINDNL